MLETRRLLSTVVVNTLADLPALSGNLISLRAAIAEADATGASTTISFDSTVFKFRQTITLSHGVLQLTGSSLITIDGPSAGLVVSGNAVGGVFSISSGADASLENLTIADGTGYQAPGSPEPAAAAFLMPAR